MVYSLRGWLGHMSLTVVDFEGGGDFGDFRAGSSPGLFGVRGSHVWF